jgi:hypothetical protein
MNSQNVTQLPKPPAFMTAFKNGFNTVASNVQVIVLPILLDLLLLFGPQFRVKKILEPVLNEMIKFGQTSATQQFPLAEQAQAFDVIREYISRINLLSILSTFPMGIPSILVPGIIENPVGFPFEINFSSLTTALLFIVLVYLVGLALSTLFFNLLANISGEKSDTFNFKTLSWQYLQVLSFSVWIFIILCIIIFPILFVINLLQLINVTISQLVLYIFLFFLLWLCFPLIFIPHGIFVYNQNTFSAALTSYRLVRFALPNSGLFMTITILIYVGSLGLWILPPENSWFILAGITGHAFLFSCLLVSTFYYYRGCVNWMREVLKHTSQPSIRSI